jgi:hypothetical protein
MRLIYLANPYHSEDSNIMDRRHNFLMDVLARLSHIENDLVFYSPIAHWHETAKHHELPTDFHYWREKDFYMIRKSHSVWVVPFDGWRESFGVQQELEYAEDIGRPVMYLIDWSESVVVTPDAPVNGIVLPG